MGGMCIPGGGGTFGRDAHLVMVTLALQFTLKLGEWMYAAYWQSPSFPLVGFKRSGAPESSHQPQNPKPELDDVAVPAKVICQSAGPPPYAPAGVAPKTPMAAAAISPRSRR